MKVKDFIPKDKEELLIHAIKTAEKNTSGEIRVHIENKCKGEVLDRAVEVFQKLKMHKTNEANGVLFYVAMNDRRFAVIGDKGINQKVPSNFWEEVRELVFSHFSKEEYVQGIAEGVMKAGEKLKEFFPYQSDDVNELPDDISYNDN